MNKRNQKIAIAALSALILGSGLAPFQAKAASLAPVAQAQKAAITNYGEAVQRLIDKGVIQGDTKGNIQPNKPVSNAELLKLILLTLELNVDETSSNAPGAKWYDSYFSSAVTNGLIGDSEAITPNKPATSADMAAIIAKALQRDVKSVQHWMNALSISGDNVTRAKTAELLVKSEEAIRSKNARITAIKALNKITFEVTFDAPLALEDEAMAAATANFIFDGGIKLVNQPRLKTGAVSTYIVPVQTMEDGATYTLNYKGEQELKAAASDELIRLNTARQVTSDTFEIDSSRADGVIDYGYLISAYSGGRGANAVVVDEHNRLDGKPMQIIPSLASRQAVLTPEGGQPITVFYVGFTQSTDGKQEPKFRLPQGQTLQAGVKYTVSADWFTAKEASFVAEAIAPLAIASAEAVNETTLNVTLAQDPGDELFAYRSVQLKDSDGSTWTAQYKVQTRKGATGVFELQNDGKLQSGISYKVMPVGTWATAGDISFIAK